jgi:putative endonuclease
VAQNKRKVGGAYEQKAAQFLMENGLQILEYNFRCRRGEIDLIAKDGKTFVFVEVKYRRKRGSGYAVSAVDGKKQWVISRVACYYLGTRIHSIDVPCRFDVVAFDGGACTWIRDAFAYLP